MKKRWISLALASVFVFSSATLAGCGDLFTPVPEPEPNPPQTTPEPEEPEEPEKKPDEGENTAALLPKAVAELRKDFPALTFDYSAEFSGYTASGEAQTDAREGTALGTLTFNMGEFLEADAALGYTLTQAGKSDRGYGIGYLRPDAVYYGTGSWEEAEAEEGDFSALAAAYRGENGLKLSRGKVEEGTPYDTAFGVAPKAVPVLVKLARNLLVYKNGGLVKSESGYTLTADLLASLDSVLATFEEECGEINMPVLIVLGSFLERPAIQSLLGSMLYGMTAEELTVIFEGTMSEETLAVLPEAGGMSALDYLYACLESEELFSYLSQKLGYDFGDTVFGEVITSLSDIPLEALSLKVFGCSFLRLDEEIALLREDIAGGLARLAYGEEASAENVTLSVTAWYDADCTLEKLTFEAAGTLTRPVQGEEGPTGELKTDTAALSGTAHLLSEKAELEDVTTLNYEDVALPELTPPDPEGGSDDNGGNGGDGGNGTDSGDGGNGGNGGSGTDSGDGGNGGDGGSGADSGAAD